MQAIIDSLLENDVVGWAIGLSATWIAARSWANSKINLAVFAVRSIVAEVQQSYVDGLKAGRLPDSESGTRLTNAERKLARGLAVDKLRAFLGLRGIQVALWIMGWGQAPEDWIGDQVEAAVADRKLLGAGGRLGKR